MRKIIVSIFLVSTAFVYTATSPVARSDESKAGTYEQQPGEAPVSTVEKGEVAPGNLTQEGIGISPQVGVVNYHDNFGDTCNRVTYGMTTDMNIPKLSMNTPDVFLGPQLGFFYSHLGSGNAGGFGSSPSDGSAIGVAGTNMFFIPTDLKLGYNIGNFRPAIHGGANLYYTSSADNFSLGASPATGTGSQWSYLPDVGLDLEYGITKSIALIARPDITFAGSNRIWNASLGATIPLG